MKLSDWPIEAEDGGGFACVFEPTRDGEPCQVYLDVPMPGGGRATLCGTTFGELAGAIVKHAKDRHGIEIERDGVWYRSFTPDGQLWAESSDVDDFRSGIYHNEQEREERTLDPLQLTCERIAVYTVAFAEEWKP